MGEKNGRPDRWWPRGPLRPSERPSESDVKQAEAVIPGIPVEVVENDRGGTEFFFGRKPR
ncbi:MAG: hypothetical protein V4449_00215 [Patescibacteria group bacterium]